MQKGEDGKGNTGRERRRGSAGRERGRGSVGRGIIRRVQGGKEGEGV